LPAVIIENMKSKC